MSYNIGEMDRKISLQKGNKIVLPATPEMKRVGYGTGVGVFHLTPEGKFSSPWALKKLMRGCRAAESKVMGKRLRNEAGILRKLNHPNIVGYRDFWTTSDGRECLALEECNASLGDIIESRIEQTQDPFPVDIISRMAFDIANALDYIHNTVHLLHGDIKSHNILIKGDFEVIKLCDFGVSLPLNADGSLDIIAAGKECSYIGTSLWSAPEVCQNAARQIVTDKADIFAYGLTIWEMLTNEAPHCPASSDSSFDDEEYEALLNSLIGTRPPVPEAVNRNNSYRSIISLFVNCTEKNYKDRYSAVDALKFCRENNFK